MTDYTKTVDFAAKDALPTGNPGKVAKGTEINTEFANLQTAIATKYDAGDTILFADGSVSSPGAAFSADADCGLFRVNTNAFAVSVGATQAVKWFLSSGVAQSLFADGTAALPSQSFDTDPDTGIYRVAANTGGLTAGGSNTAQWNSAQFFVGDGTQALPGLAFMNDTNTGIQRPSADAMSFSCGGNRAFAISPQGALLQDGTVSVPSLAFDSDGNTGIYKVTTDGLGITCGGVRAATFGLVGGNVQAFISNGTAAQPAWAFDADPNTGVFSGGADVLSFSAGGTRRLSVYAAQIYATVPITPDDGSASAPMFTFDQDKDTGFYRDTSNQIAIALGGTTAGQIAQGSFTIAVTSGLTTTPSGTAVWQRFGNVVHLFIPTLSGTSNGSSFQCNAALPAAIRPTNDQVVSGGVGTNSGGAVAVQAWLIASTGMVAFGFNGANGTWGTSLGKSAGGTTITYTLGV